MEDKCLICNNKANVTNKDLLVVEVNCPHCGHYYYEKAFKTSYDFYLSQQDREINKKIQKLMKKLIKKDNVCFVDDFEKTTVDSFVVYELRDILNLIGLDVAHNNTIDSNYKD